MEYKVPSGWLMPMLAAFRAKRPMGLERQKLPVKREPVDNVLNTVIGDLVRICVQEHRDNGVKPDEIARKATVYEQCYDKVERYLDKIELQRLRSGGNLD